MKAVRLQLATRTLLNPRAPQWARVPSEDVRMAGTRADLQPSNYVRTAWAGKAVGAVRLLKVRAAHNGKHVFFRLEWPDATENAGYANGSVFPDAAAVLFPLNGGSPLDRMGSAAAPLNAWYWRASLPAGGGQNLIVRGFASEEQTAGRYIQTQALWDDGTWRLVLARPLEVVSGETVRLAPGHPTSVAFAVWEGSSQERGGLHSYSREWRDLAIE